MSRGEDRGTGGMHIISVTGATHVSDAATIKAQRDEAIALLRAIFDHDRSTVYPSAIELGLMNGNDLETKYREFLARVNL